MTKREADPEADDGIVSEDITQLMEHIELTSEQRLASGPDWELSRPAEDLDDAPVMVGDEHMEIPDLEAMEVAGDLEMFMDTELDLNRRLLQVEDEQLELAAGLTVERSRWQKRVESLQIDLAEHSQLLAERETEVEELSAQLASMTLERDGNIAELRELRQSVGPAEAAAQQRVLAPAQSAIDSLRERLRERGRALLVARGEIDRLRADQEQLVAGLAERGDFIQRLHERLRELESDNRGDGEIRKLLRRFFGSEQRAEAPPAEARTQAAEPPAMEDPSPRRVVIEEPQPALQHEDTPTSGQVEPRLRRYLIGLDLIGRVHEITRPRISIGRTQDNDLRIVEPTISRLHAMLKVKGQNVTVIDANSRNGVYVNGIQVRHSRLNDGDMLTFGSVRFRYRVGSGSSGGGYGSA